LSISKEEKREIRAGTVHIGAYVSFGLFAVAALIAGGRMIEKVDRNEKEIAKISESIDEKSEKILFLQSQIQAMNLKQKFHLKETE
jgi:hypothetical protein